MTTEAPVRVGSPLGLLVSIHDVTPALAPFVERLWACCVDAGVRPALLVVPNWHGAWPLREYPTFVAWLRERQAEGAEVLLHGERHDEVGLDRDLAAHVLAMGRTAREGEFLMLGRRAAHARITRGVALLRALGLPPVGFVPPAWLARRSCLGATRDAGLPLLEESGALWVRAGGRRWRRVASPAVRWSARTSVRAWGSVLAATLAWRHRGRGAPVRLALHPQDLGHPAVARSVLRELGRWTAERAAIRYGDLVGAGRGVAAWP